MFTIGQFSTLSQISIKTLRFYDECELLKPTYTDAATGYRYYSANLLRRLNRILVFKELGFSLSEIAFLLDGDLPAAQVKDMLQAKQSEMKQQIAREKARLAQVEAWLGEIEAEGSVPKYEIIVKKSAPRLVASVRGTIADYAESAELFGEINDYMGKYQVKKQFGSLWHICAGQGRELDCEAFIFLEKPVPGNKRINVFELPVATVASVIYQGGDEVGEQAYAAGKTWIKTRGYRIAAPKRELYWQGDVMRDDVSGITEIQFPILKS
ncbi:MerR family transcriptional regulator [soil metagenome]